MNKFVKKESLLGGIRSDDNNKPDFSYMPYKILEKIVMYLKNEGIKHGIPMNNWLKLTTSEDVETAKRKLLRHAFKLIHGINDGEDHLMCILFNCLVLIRNREKGD